MNILSSFTHLHVAMSQMHVHVKHTMEVSGFNQLFGYP